MDVIEMLLQRRMIQLERAKIESYESDSDTFQVYVYKYHTTFTAVRPKWMIEKIVVDIPSQDVTIPGQTVTDSSGDTVEIPEQTITIPGQTVEVSLDTAPANYVGKDVIVAMWINESAEWQVVIIDEII